MGRGLVGAQRIDLVGYEGLRLADQGSIGLGTGLVARVSVRGPAHGHGLGLGRLLGSRSGSWHMCGARSALVLYTGHFRRELRNHYLEICLGICLHAIPAGRGARTLWPCYPYPPSIRLRFGGFSSEI